MTSDFSTLFEDKNATKRGSFPRLIPEIAVAKTVFDLDWPRLPHNLG